MLLVPGALDEMDSRNHSLFDPCVYVVFRAPIWALCFKGSKYLYSTYTDLKVGI